MADSELPANVRALFEAADKAPVSADRTAIRAKVLATTGGAGAGGSSAAKIVMGAAVAVVVVGGAYFALHTRRTAVAVSPSVGVSVSDRPATPTPTTTIPEPARAVSAPANVAAPRPPTIARSAPAPAKTATRPSTDAVEQPGDEAAWLAKATYALRSGDPERTLSLVEGYTHVFAHGALAEERDALEIEALLALGRRDAAHAAAQRFAQQYPQSVHASLVTRALQPGSSP